MLKSGEQCTSAIARDIQTGELEKQWLLRCLWDCHNDVEIPDFGEKGSLIPWKTIDVLKSYGFNPRTDCQPNYEKPEGIIYRIQRIQNWVRWNVPLDFIGAVDDREVTLVTLETLNKWCGFKRTTRKHHPYERSIHGSERIELIEITFSGDLALNCSYNERDRYYKLLSVQLGFPLDTLKFEKKGNTFYEVRLQHPFLAKVLNDIVHFECTENTNLAVLTNQILDAYKESRNYIDIKRYKVDYELVVLRNIREFARVQENPDGPHPEFLEVPLYWVDPKDHTEFFIEDVFRKLSLDPVKQLEDLVSKLAIEENWYNPQYIVRCLFPAGSMFLKTSVEPTASKPGGGVEYIYVGDSELTPKIQVLSVSKI